MINVSEKFKELMQNNTDFKEFAEITFADGRSLSIDESGFTVANNGVTDGASSNSIPIGEALCRSAQIELLNDDGHLQSYDFTGARIRLYTTFDLGDAVERIENGIFTVTQPETYGTTVAVMAFDDMYRADRQFNTSLSFPTTARTLLDDICSRCDILLASASFRNQNFVINAKPVGEYTFRQIIGYIAMIAGGNARINRQGALEILSYTFDWENAHNLTEWVNLKTDASDIVITGVQTSKSTAAEDDSDTETIILEGSEGYVIPVSNPLAVGQEQTLVSLLGEVLIGATFRKFEGDYIAYPIAEFMDMAKITDWAGNTYNTFLTDVDFVFFGFTTMKNSATSGLRLASQYRSPAQGAIIKAIELVKKEKTDRELAIENLNKVLENSSGLYPTYEKQEDGSTITYFHDKPTLAESKNVIKITADAVGVSNDGGKTYPFGFFLTGTMITKLLYAEGINADYIDAGAITVKDQQGKIIFQADFATGKVMISGDCVMIGDKTATDAIKDVMDTATAAASNMTMQLDNDHATVPVDADGNYEKFPEGITTRPIVMYGSKDVTNQCSFSITESAAISGAWDSGTRTYVVTALEADTAWVDIKATYLGTLSVSKRFTVSKLHAGMVGPPGRVYTLETSASIVKIGKDNVYNPDAISAAAYYREDTNARQAYNGRFRIRETADGYTWNTIYESTQDESNIEHYLYTFFRTTDGKLIQASNGSYLAMPRAISEIEISLFSSGDAEELIDIKRVSVLKEVAALTQEEIFNILTDDGAAKGIYKIGKELYVNATYMRAGVLADLLGRNRWNLETGEFRLSGMATVDGKQIADKEAVAATEKALKEAIEKVNNSVTDVEKQINMENVFNLWFQNGKTKGFLLDSNGDLYVSFSYARGGTLKLGGVNNGNGLLSILDANGSQVGYIDNTGVNFKKGTFSGKVTAETGKIGGFTIDKTNLHTGNRTTINSVGAGAYLGNNGFSCSDGKNKLANLNTGYLWIRTTAARSSANGIYMERYGASSRGYISAELIALEDTADELITEDYFRVNKSGLSVRGSKNRIAKTNNYQDRLLYCYEMGSPFFGDIGTATIGADGKCFVDIDDIFSETVIPEMEYYVFLQKEGEGDLYVSQKTETYFEVSGTPGLRFSWELKARQSGYGYERLNNYLPAEEQEIDYAQQAICMMNDFYQEQEE